MSTIRFTTDGPEEPSNVLSPAGQRRSIAAAFAQAFTLFGAATWFAVDTMTVGDHVALAGFVGSLVSISARLLDHGAFTMSTYARRKTDWWDRAYIATRISLGGALGIAAAYVTTAVQAGLGTTHHAPLLPVVASFVAAYAFKAQPISLK